jgi:GNAT superfamily N-acetyltransferase
LNDHVQLSIQQFSNAWRLMCGASSRRAIESVDDVDLVFSGLPVSFFNIAIATGRGLSADALAACSRRATDWAADKAVPWFFIATHEALDEGVDAAATLDGCDFAPVMPLTGMLATRLAPAGRVADEALQLTTPGDDEGCGALVAVNSKAYGMALAAAGDVVGRSSFWTSQFPVVGLKEGTPVSCAAVLMVDGHRYVALVATDPDHQRRGHAEAAMRGALDAAAARHGDRPTVLHATEAGRPVYERMGYTTIARHTLFMEKRFLVEH